MSNWSGKLVPKVQFIVQRTVFVQTGTGLRDFESLKQFVCKFENSTTGLSKLCKCSLFIRKGHNHVDKRAGLKQAGAPKHSCHLVCLGLFCSHLFPPPPMFSVEGMISD